MLTTLHLLYIVLKYCLILTFVRLLTTAFGWEFGVSRQYLHFLELIFHMGEKQIEKVESENKLLLANGHGGSKKTTNLSTEAANQAAITNSGLHLEDEEEENQNDDSDGNVVSLIGEPMRFKSMRSQKPQVERAKSRVPLAASASSSSLVVANQEFELAASGLTSTKECGRKTSCFIRPTQLDSFSPQPKMCRVSTPSGPPVFLLDDDDDDDDDDDNNGNSNASNGYHGQPQQQKNGTNHLQPAKQEFHLDDTCRLVVKGISAIIDDQVTKRFTTEELKTWNLLTRTYAKNYQFMSRSLGLCWFCGFLVRYTILLPLRIVFMLTGSIWLICTMTLVGLLPKTLRSKSYCLFSLMSFRMLSCGITSRLRFHNRQYRAKMGDICVANHTSPIDVVLLACDNCYALVGQRHGGVLGLLEHALSRATDHVWFDRDEVRDRQLVTQRLKEHVNTKSNLPVLIFPEGTCINNSAVMMFRKGSFETTDRVCPVAIKYDPRFGDPFWNSSKQTYVQYLLLMMSSWAIKCDVWYLPPMERLPGESSVEFANRVKAEIAKQGGLKDLAWDGQLKRTSAKVEWKHQQQEDFVKRLKLDMID